MDWHSHLPRQARWTADYGAVLFKQTGLENSMRILRWLRKPVPVLTTRRQQEHLFGLDINNVFLTTAAGHAPA